MLDAIDDDELGKVVMMELKIKTELNYSDCEKDRRYKESKDTCTSIYNESDISAGIRDGF